MQILDGKATAAQIRAELKEEIDASLKEHTRPPGLAVILVGDNSASQVYVRNKQKACQEVGINSIVHILPADTGEDELLELIRDLDGQAEIDGILLQLPLPAGIDAQKCLEAIVPEKDVDGFHPLNMGKLALGLPGHVPCTPAGILELLKRNDIPIAGKKAVILGRSDIVGKPLAMLLARRGNDATVTICHTATPDLKKECADADLLFVAIGKARSITADMIPAGCVVVDVGIHRTENGLCGDVDQESICKKVAALTPVPGGVGPMTIAMLLANTVRSWRRNMARQAV